MAIKKKDLNFIKKKISESIRPLFFFDDDADGLSSFLILYDLVKEGKGIIIKTSPDLSLKYLQQVKEYSPDLVIILDKPDVSQEFIDKVHVPIIWLDHHEPQKRHNVHYFNPRIDDDKDNRPTTYWAHQINPENLWIATVGCVADWFVPEFAKDFKKQYPDILNKLNKNPAELLFNSRFGELCKLFNFILKGKTKDSLTCIKILTRIKDPHEILDKTTPQGKFLYKKYTSAKKEYDQILSEVRPPKDNLLVFKYSADRTSYTSELSNELLYRYHDKMLIICREKSGEMRCSLRSTKLNVAKILKESLTDVRGYGGGHEHACGACIDVDDFPRFVENVRSKISK